MVQVQWLRCSTRYGLETLLQCAKRVETKNQKVLRAESCICRGYRGKTGTETFFSLTPSWTELKQMNRKMVKVIFNHYGFGSGYTNTDLKICQYLCSHIKITYCRFHIKALLRDVHVRFVKSLFTDFQKQ